MILLIMFIFVGYVWPCGPVHEWKTLREETRKVFGARAAYDTAVGLLASLRGDYPTRENSLGLVIVESVDASSQAAGSRAAGVLEDSLRAAAAEERSFSYIDTDTLRDYLKRTGISSERLINPAVSSRAADALDFDALIWFQIRDYAVTDSRCLDVLEYENTVIVDIHEQKAVVRVKVVDARTARILWIDEQAAGCIYQNIFLVHGVLPAAGLTTEVIESTGLEGNSTITGLEPETMLNLPPEVSFEMFISGTTTELSALPGLTVEIVEGSESYQLSPQKNRYWQPHDETTH